MSSDRGLAHLEPRDQQRHSRGDRAAVNIKALASGAGKRARARDKRASGREPGTLRVALRDWPVSLRLIALITAALVMGLVFGGLRVANAVGSADQFGRVAQLASLGEQVTILVQDLQNERDETAGVAAGASPAALTQLYRATDMTAVKVGALAAAVGSGFPANIRSSVAAVVSDTENLASVRNLAKGNVNPTTLITDYANPLSDMITLTDQIAQGVSDPALANDVRTLNSLSQAKEQVAEQRALLFNALTQRFFSSGVESAINTAASEEQLNESAFQTTATPAEQSAFGTVLASSQVSSAATIEDFMLSDSEPFTDIVNLGISENQAPAMWNSLMSGKINQMQGVGLTIAGNILARAQALGSGARQSALATAAVTAGVLLVVLVATVIVARSLVLPLRRLRAGALDIATMQLPERIRQMAESEDSDTSMEIAPIDVVSADEIGQVARAFDQVHQEAVRLAGNEALLRANFNAMFINLSRRSRSLNERLARMIDSLEQNEDDPDRLSNLFSMDHLVTRMRRNSENLLLLAGYESARKWSEPMSLADVARAAASEIEQYNRVTLNIQPGVSVIGQAVSDVVHLLAELMENATLFSPDDTRVQVSGQELTSGGVLIEITDMGIGVSEARLTEMNWRLDNPPTMDVSVSRHMGLFAVARLAERHGVRVRLRPANPQGLSALVWLPDSAVERTAPSYAGAGGRWRQSLHPQGAKGAQGSTPQPGGGRTFGPDSWTAGRQAAEIAADPIRGEQTHAGLPTRIPQANLIPGSVANGRMGSPADAYGTALGTAPRPKRSPEMARSRLSGFQRGARRARGSNLTTGEGADR
jgi:signal transduction histidine kinase